MDGELPTVVIPSGDERRSCTVNETSMKVLFHAIATIATIAFFVQIAKIVHIAFVAIS